MRILIALLMLTAPALAQERCAPLETIVAGLLNGYGEVMVFEAIAEPDGRPGVPIIWFANPLTRTWTKIGRLTPLPVYCFLEKGTGFDIPHPVDTDAPSL